jgi:hypothetical protein
LAKIIFPEKDFSASLITQKERKRTWMCWHTPVIPPFRELKQEDHEFEDNLGYIVQ